MRSYLLTCLLSVILSRAAAFAPITASKPASAGRKALGMVPPGAELPIFLEDYYLLMQSATSAMFSGLGDVIAQSKDVMDGKKSYNPTRTFHYTLKGLGGGVMWTIWYETADIWSLDLTHQLFGGGVPEDSNVEKAAQVSISIVLEQMLVCPLMYAFWDIPVPALLSGSPLRTIPYQVQSKLGDLLIANAKLWTPVNIVVYSLPLEFRLLLSSMADVVWQSINSSIATREVVVVLQVDGEESTNKASVSAPMVQTNNHGSAVQTAPGQLLAEESQMKY
jgi:hypothetical protein